MVSTGGFRKGALNNDFPTYPFIFHSWGIKSWFFSSFTIFFHENIHSSSFSLIVLARYFTFALSYRFLFSLHPHLHFTFAKVLPLSCLFNTRIMLVIVHIYREEKVIGFGIKLEIHFPLRSDPNVTLSCRFKNFFFR